jgi:hypothetical protein
LCTADRNTAVIGIDARTVVIAGSESRPWSTSSDRPRPIALARPPHGRIGGAGSAFAVNDQVSIVAVVRDGRAIATTVAGLAASDLNGPPMDSVTATP